MQPDARRASSRCCARMGADVTLTPTGEACGEPVGELRVRASELRATTIAGDEIPNVIDEIPALAIAAAFADGVTEVRDAAELVVKESNRIGTLRDGADEARRRRRDPRRRPLDPGRAGRGGRVRQPRRPPHRDGDGRRRQRARRGLDGHGLARGGVVVSRVRARSRPPDRGRRAMTTVIAIDGPSGSGKSTVARGVAARLGLPVLDTGAMYRAVTLAVLEAGDPARRRPDVRGDRAQRRDHGRRRPDDARRPRRERRDPGPDRDRCGVDRVRASRGARDPRRAASASGSVATAAGWSRAATSARSCSPTRR